MKRLYKRRRQSRRRITRRRQSRRSTRRITRRRQSRRRITRRRQSRRSTRRITRRRQSRRSRRSRRSAQIITNGLKIDKYKDLLKKFGKPLGSGRDATVYKYDDSKVIKISKPVKSFGSVLQKRFDNEIEVSTLVAKHNIGPKIYDHGTFYFKDLEKLSTYIVMERLDSLDRKKICTEDYQKQYIDIFISLSKLGVINDDPNPANFMISNSNGKLVMIDFGRARKINDFKKDLSKTMIKNISLAILIAFDRINGLFRNCKNNETLVNSLWDLGSESNRKTLTTMIPNRDAFKWLV
jgi:serine/threonine protein kinase